MSAPVTDPPTVNPDQAAAPPAGWRGPILPVNTESGDGRVYTLDDDTLDVRPLPLPLCAQDEIADGHDGGRVVGRIDRVWLEDGAVWGEGVFDVDDPNAAAWARRLQTGHAGWISADMDRTQYTQIPRDMHGNEVDPEQIATGAVEEGTPLLRVSQWRIMGATLVAHPAFAEAKITAAEPAPVVEPVTAALTAAGVVYAVTDFTMPEADGPTAITVTPDGKVFGHLCLWGTCHIGYAGSCVTPPRSPSEYKYFHQGIVATTAGDVPVGKLTLGTGHAGMNADARGATAHYDNSGTATAVVRAVDGEHGVWFSGRVLPAVSDERVAEMRRCGVSGDWRSIGGALELVAALCVNTPGFPVPRTESLAAGGHFALVAAGVVANKPDGGTRKLCTETAAVEVAADQAALLASLDARVFGPELAALDTRMAAARLDQLDRRMRDAQLARLDQRVAAAADGNPVDDRQAKPLERYWTSGKGLARWAGSPTPYRTLVAELSREIGARMTPGQIKGLAAVYFRKRFGIWPGERGGDNPAGPGALNAAGASGDHSGDAMIALVPAAEDAARLAVADGEPVEELHCTIAYYSDADLLPDPDTAAVGLAGVDGPITATISGTAVFDGDNPCAVYLVQAPGLSALHDALVAEAGTFDAYVPHITAAYRPDAELTDRLGTITFDRVRIAARGEVADYDLAEPIVAGVGRARRKTVHGFFPQNRGWFSPSEHGLPTPSDNPPELGGGPSARKKTKDRATPPHPHSLPKWSESERSSRQNSALPEYRGDALEQHEIEFVERMQALGEDVEWLSRAPRDPGTKVRPASNDFIWKSRNAQFAELKSTSTNPRTIRRRITDAVLSARSNPKPVVKENFVVDLGPAALDPHLRHALSRFNSERQRQATPGREPVQIQELWVMAQGQLHQIDLV